LFRKEGLANVVPEQARDKKSGAETFRLEATEANATYLEKFPQDYIHASIKETESQFICQQTTQLLNEHSAVNEDLVDIPLRR
jgi:hypothetical protein